MIWAGFFYYGFPRCWRNEALILTFDPHLYCGAIHDRDTQSSVAAMTSAANNLGLVGLPRPVKELAAAAAPSSIRKYRHRLRR
jgi:hypothetical protein